MKELLSIISPFNAFKTLFGSIHKESWSDAIKSTIGLWLVIPLTGWMLFGMILFSVYSFVIGMEVDRSLFEAIDLYFISGTVIDGGNPAWMLHGTFILILFLVQLNRAHREYKEKMNMEKYTSWSDKPKVGKI